MKISINKIPSLSPAELEVWKLIASGEGRKQTAAARDCSVKTIDSILANISTKLGKPTNAAYLIRAGIAMGIVPTPKPEDFPEFIQ